MENNKPFASLDDINAIVLVADKEGEIIYANKAVETILGYDPQSVLGDGWWKITAKQEENDVRKEKTALLAKGVSSLEDRHLYENLLYTKDGKKVWTQWTNTINKEGNLVGIAQDITEKKTLEEALTKKNKENELLLKEIHHRVKNNLQIISSFLNLQFRDFENENVQIALDKSKDRINSIALIHTKLFQSGLLASVNFGEYMEQVAQGIQAAYAVNTEVDIKISCETILLEIDLSINLGLIINELLTNAFKHAFGQRQDGEIQVSLETKESEYHLIVQDNGIGEAEDLKAEGSLGLEIVSALVEQIHGTIDVESENGFKYLIRFPS